MNKPHQLTVEEVRERFLDHVHGLVDYWDRETRVQTCRERIEGVAFSILAAIDGSSVAIPGFLLVPNPHKDDKAYQRSMGEDWFPPSPKGKVVDIAGSLHEHFAAGKRKRTRKER